ncbi:sigma-70 family RNA polymerase sigma factor [Paracraurococcus lichenis]|uniref:Sigma-70 family RNA polymerase sigma factor n=1 Tax=Paracraurococcus lichenis TaxID=3064888 RepID=A0ABT9E4Z5_9PROT|nr:sigma-70 family RNA polymerase sigma factor [Paracraurococcus sp. LOR1-02]MDO9711177.1 sigma-70 family RNA polymerase sigma factor [Paracraurococcus sp. LOR1-02]
MTEQATDTGLRSALAELLPELRAFARFLCGNAAQADDLVQEALARTLRSLDAQEERVTDLRAWCLAVVRNIFHEELRARKRETVRLRDAVPEEPAPPAQETPGQMRDLARALKELPPLLREAVILVGAQGLSHQEAAEICGVPIGTMKARVSRARKLLAAALGRVTA